MIFNFFIYIYLQWIQTFCPRNWTQNLIFSFFSIFTVKTPKNPTKRKKEKKTETPCTGQQAPGTPGTPGSLPQQQQASQPLQSQQDAGSDPESEKNKKKKARTTFTGRQIFELEKQFEIKKYLSSSERAEMAKLLNVTETQVRRLSPLFFYLFGYIFNLLSEILWVFQLGVFFLIHKWTLHVSYRFYESDKSDVLDGHEIGPVFFSKIFCLKIRWCPLHLIFRSYLHNWLFTVDCLPTR